MSTPADALRRLIAQAVATHEAVAVSLGINPTDLRCVQLVAGEPGITPSRLAELSGLTTGAITGVLDRLERAGFVVRASDPADRRRTLVHLAADRADELAGQYEPLIARAVEASSGWSPEARDNLARYLDDVGQALAAEAAELWARARGGMVGEDRYLAPVGEARRARLVLSTGAPRVSIGAAALGQQVRMVAETAATRLRLGPGDPQGELITADFVGPPPDMRTADGVVTMRYRRRMLDTRSREVRAHLNRSLPWTIEVDGGLTDLDGDLREVPLAGLGVRGGLNHFDLRLPRPDGTVRLSIEGGSSAGRIRRPADVPVAIEARGGVSRLRFDGRRHDASGTTLTLQSAGYARTPDRYEIDIEGGISDLVIGS